MENSPKFTESEMYPSPLLAFGAETPRNRQNSPKPKESTVETGQEYNRVSRHRKPNVYVLGNHVSLLIIAQL